MCGRQVENPCMCVGSEYRNGGREKEINCSNKRTVVRCENMYGGGGR